MNRRRDILLISTLFIVIYGFSCINSTRTKKVNDSKTTKLDGFHDNGDGTITDTKTGFMWTKKDSYADLERCLNWNDAKKYVDELKTGGYDDWRMPTIKEMKTIFNLKYEVENSIAPKAPLLYNPVFAPNGAWECWSSEIVGSGNVRCMSFYYNGQIYESNRDICHPYGVRAIRP